MEVDHGGRLNVLLAQDLHLDRRVGELVGEVVQEVWEVGRRSVDDPHDETRRLGLVLAERQAHKLLGESLHLGRGEPGELLAVGVGQRGAAVGLLLDVNEVAELEAGKAWHWGAVERRAVAQPVPDRGGDGGRGVGRKRRILLVVVLVLVVVLLLLHCCGVVEQSAAAVDAIVRIYPGEKVGQGQMHS